MKCPLCREIGLIMTERQQHYSEGPHYTEHGSYNDDYRDGYHRKKKRGGWLDELFEFD